MNYGLYKTTYTTDVLRIAEYVKWSPSGAKIRRIELKRETAQQGNNIRFSYSVVKQDYSRNYGKNVYDKYEYTACKDEPYAHVQFNSCIWYAHVTDNMEEIFTFDGSLQQYLQSIAGSLVLPKMEKLTEVSFKEGWKMFKSGLLANTLYHKVERLFVVASGTNLFFFNEDMVLVEEPKHFKTTDIPPGNRIYEISCGGSQNTTKLLDVVLDIPLERRIEWLGEKLSPVLYTFEDFNQKPWWTNCIEYVILTRPEHRFGNGEQRYMFKMKKT